MPDVTLYDTRTRSLLPFEPRDPSRVGIYACGPTVYGRVHVGNARPFIVFSQLKRFLVHEGYGVTLVGNITDINDKIYDAAEGRAAVRGARGGDGGVVHQGHGAAGAGAAGRRAVATEYIDQIIALIARLIEGGSAYACEGDVYFRVRTLEDYGELSRRDIDQMDQGEGVEGADLKEDPLDFALWKAWKEGEDTSWDAPWGRGRPGWHIECSAMAEALLGVEFDIHGGGVDLVFPHHENEAAQTFAARGKPLARIWMHNGMLELAAEKMSKSVGNIRGLGEVLDEVDAEVFVLFMSTGHYRQPLAFSDEALEDARRSAARIREAGRRLLAGPVAGGAGAIPRRLLRRAAQRLQHRRGAGLALRVDSRGEPLRGGRRQRALVEMLDVLGLVGLIAAEEGAPPEAVALAEQRETARREKDWAEADRLRDELRALGWEVRDGPDGPELVPDVLSRRAAEQMTKEDGGRELVKVVAAVASAARVGRAGNRRRPGRWRAAAAVRRRRRRGRPRRRRSGGGRGGAGGRRRAAAVAAAAARGGSASGGGGARRRRGWGGGSAAAVRRAAVRVAAAAGSRRVAAARSRRRRAAAGYGGGGGAGRGGSARGYGGAAARRWRRPRRRGLRRRRVAARAWRRGLRRRGRGGGGGGRGGAGYGGDGSRCWRSPGAAVRATAATVAVLAARAAARLRRRRSRWRRPRRAGGRRRRSRRSGSRWRRGLQRRRRARRCGSRRRGRAAVPAGRRSSPAARAGEGRGGARDFAPAVPEGAVTSRRMVIYGRNPVRGGAARQAQGAPDLDDLAGGVGRRRGHDHDRRGDRGARRERRPSGRVRARGPVPVRGRGRAAEDDGPAADRARRDHRPAEPRRDRPHRGGRGGDRGRHPGATQRRRSRPRCARRRRARSSTFRSRGSRTSPTSCRRPRTPALGLRRGRRRRPRTTTSPTTPGRS